MAGVVPEACPQKCYYTIKAIIDIQNRELKGV
jgi:hypothetical protein